MKQPKEFGLLKQMSRDIKVVKTRLMKMESLLEGEELTKEELRQIRLSEEQIKKGKYVTLDQLKKELGIQ